MQMKDEVPINDDQRLEREADVMGAHAIGFSPPVQRVIWSTGALDGKQTNVNWTTDNLGGDTVGTEIKAEPLGPEHLQGGPPKSGAQNKLMNLLPTDPGLANPDKYIRGHLLNDNLGGPGEPYNLFPIMANANKEHENVIESKVKQWVNTEKQWVSYHVKVNQGKIDLKNGIVNAQFACTASVLNPVNDQPINTISATINSEASVAHKTDTKNAMDLGVRAAVGPQASVHNALLSTSKKAGVVFDEETLSHLQYLFTMPEAAKALKKLVMEYEGIGKGTAEALSKYSPATETDVKVLSALKRVYQNIGNEELLAIIGDVYDEIF
ncbi:MAG: hypothetical protein EBU46_03305 [Nitrosomonadaceae bacterium]|nr:hypothetical protein [Nitrosomonadaceae bacterium]